MQIYKKLWEKKTSFFEMFMLALKELPNIQQISIQILGMG